MTDPLNDLRLSEPFTHRPDGTGGVWGWIAGSGIVVLITIILIAGWSGNSVPPAATTSGAPAQRNVAPPPTTGTAPMRHLIAPAKPVAPTMPGTQ